MEMNSENITSEEMTIQEKEEEQIYLIPEDVETTARPNEQTEIETAKQKSNIELLNSINGKLDLLLAAQQISAE